MGLLSRLGRGALGGTAMGGLAGAGAGALMSGGDPDTIAKTAMLGATAGLGMGAVGAAGRNDILREIGMDGNVQRVIQTIRSRSSPADVEFLLRELQQQDPRMFQKVIAVLQQGG